MIHLLRFFFVSTLLLAASSRAEHVIVTGGPALRQWENYRVAEDRHDHWWANFIRASTLRIEELHSAYGADARIVWLVYQPGYQTRGLEDKTPYTTWIADLAKKNQATLIWVTSGESLIKAINSRPAKAITTFDFFGHSNRYAFMLDYSNDIMAVSTAWLHERDLPRLHSSVFARNALCKSWGCHTAESMSAAWKRALGIPLEGAVGATNYTIVGQGQLPSVSGVWSR
ncbi:MAG: hypothetical protein WCP35_19955 [Verrucomicrobiota bacterium]